MRERPATTTPALQLAPASVDARAPADEPRLPAADADDGLDKYDSATLHCTE